MSQRLLRSAEDRMIAGVCGGLGAFFRVDTTIVRILFALFAFAGGSAVIVYIVLWLIIPEEGKTKPEDANTFKGTVEEALEHGATSLRDSLQEESGRRIPGRMLFGVLLVIFGVVMLIHTLFPDIIKGYAWPALLILLGAWMLWGSFPYRIRKKEQKSKSEKDKSDPSLQ